MKTHYVLLLLLFASCNTREHVVSSRSDYATSLHPTMFVARDPATEEIKFWEKRLKEHKNDEAARVKLAGLLAEKFKTSGQIEYILTSDSLYGAALRESHSSKVGLYLGLAANAITQHEFENGKDFAEKALAEKDSKATSLLVLTDVSIERGDYARANRLLEKFTNKNSFAYLIRLAKIKDHEGDLEGCIQLMERAYDRVRGNPAQASWTLSNLGDLYGHAGLVEKAYTTYLAVLRENPSDPYALKGIAWIALSHDHNTEDARTILRVLSQRKRMPESYLMLAEIASLEGNPVERTRCLNQYVQMVSQQGYQTMYQKYLAILDAEEFNNPDACIARAEREIANRPTPLSYDLLSWGYYHRGDIERALEIAQQHVVGQTQEPLAHYHLGMIYQATGDAAQARIHLQEALGSSFELGPTYTKRITAALSLL